MPDARPRRGCFKLGCLAAVAVVGILFVGFAIQVGSAFIGARRQTIEQEELSRTIEAVADLAPSPGRLILEFEVGEFTVEPGRPGEPISVEGSYDTRAYALEERFEPDSGEGWVYRVTFRQTGLIRDGGMRVLFGAKFPEIRVRIPPDVPIALEADFEKGGAEVQLGGLWLTEIDVGLEKGGLDLAIDEPLVEPVSRMRIRGKQGGLNARGIGNASPRELDFDIRMGGATLDLSGHWINDCDVSVVAKFGGSDLLLPRGVRVEGLDRGEPLRAPRSEELPGPTLRMQVRTFMAGLNVVD